MTRTLTDLRHDDLRRAAIAQARLVRNVDPADVSDINGWFLRNVPPTERADLWGRIAAAVEKIDDADDESLLDPYATLPRDYPGSCEDAFEAVVQQGNAELDAAVADVLRCGQLVPVIPLVLCGGQDQHDGHGGAA